MADIEFSRRGFGRSMAAALALSILPAGLTVKPARAAEARVYTGLVAGTGAAGYDVVAYFSEGRAVRGVRDFEASHDGARWLFSTAANRDAFIANPQRYAPQYGGYCAYAVSQGYTAKGDPNQWTIDGGRLYLNFNRAVKTLWRRDIPGYVSAANANWPGVLG